MIVLLTQFSRVLIGERIGKSGETNQDRKARYFVLTIFPCRTIVKQPQEIFKKRAYRETMERFTQIVTDLQEEVKAINEDPTLLSPARKGGDPKRKSQKMTSPSPQGVHLKKENGQLRIPILETLS